MPHGHGVENRRLQVCRKGRQLDLGESRFPTQILQQNLLPVSYRLWAYMCAFGLGLMVMMAMVMEAMVKLVMVIMAMVIMAMVMMAKVSVMVITVPVALRQVGWLHQCLYQSFHRRRAFY